jgi:RNA polymerase sigma factor (sigma-70 family)
VIACGYDCVVAVRGGVGPAAQNFEAMLASAQTGAAWACTRIWVEYAPAVAAFLKARGSREPEDLTSEVFLAVFDQLPRFDGGESAFRSFVFSIAYRRMVDELRKRARRGDHSEWSADIDPRSSASAEDVALERMGKASTLSLLDGLPEDQCNVMVLRIVADLTIEQIAAIVGKRPGAVKALQRRALDALRKKVSPGRTLSPPSNDSKE